MSDLELITPYTIISNNQVQFANSARRRILFYLQFYQSKKQSLRELYNFLMNVLVETAHTSEWNAGSIAGWFTPLLQDGNAVSLLAFVHNASLLLQHVQTHVHLTEEGCKG